MVIIKELKKVKSANVYFGLNLKCFKTCENWIPLSYCPITIELYLTTDVLKPIVNRTGLFTATSTSITWSVTKPSKDMSILLTIAYMHSMLKY